MTRGYKDGKMETDVKEREGRSIRLLLCCHFLQRESFLT